MSIKERQINTKTNEVLLSELKAGRYPNITFIQQAVAKKFKNKPAGLPRFSLKRAESNTVSSSADYNTMMEEAHEDLTTAFDEVSYQVDRMMSIADYYDTEKYNINLSIKKINRRMEELEEKLKDRGLRTVIFDTFNDYTRLEFEGDKSRSLPDTDAFVDLRNGYATLEHVQKGQDKIDISKAAIKVSSITGFSEFTELTAASNTLNDMINEGWRQQCVLNDVREASIRVEITLKEPTLMNTLSIISQSPRSTKILLRLYREDGTYKELKMQEVFGFNEWMFEREVFSKIEFTMIKEEADVTVGAAYYYYFGAENISVRNVDYVSTSQVVSSAHHVNRVVDKISIGVDEYVPPMTDIKYFVAEDEMDGNIIEWRAITPGTKIEMGRILSQEAEITPLSSGYGTFHSTYYDHDYYTVGQIADKPISHTIQLYMGSGMVQVDEVQFSAGNSFTPSLAEWKGLLEFDRKYVNLDDISNGRTLKVNAGQMGRMTMYITMKEAYTLMANPITLEGIEATVYLNNTKIRGINGDYTYNFTKGVNKIEIIYYAHNGGEIAPNLSKTYLASIGMVEVFSQADPMQEVDLYDLQNNTSKRDYTRFAVDKNRNIIVNYNPLTINAGGTGVSYKLKYKYKKPDVKDDIYIRFMAVLSNKRQDITPILNSYKLIIE